MSIEDFLRTAPQRREELIAKIKKEARGANPELLAAVHEKTQKEVQQGTMGPARTREYLLEKYGKYWNGCQRFGIHQGVTESGDPKYRCIDNHATSGVNDAASRRQKIWMSNVASIMLQSKKLEQAILDHDLTGWNWEVSAASRDLKAAYRQVPLPDSQIGLTIILVWNPNTEEVEFHELFGQPFGAGHAVPNFYRLAAWLKTAARRLLHINVDHFFDDFWIIEPRCTIGSAVHSFQRLMELCGIVWDPEKDQGPSPLWTALGVVFDMVALRSSGSLKIKPKEKRRLNAILELMQVLEANLLAPSQAARLFGKLDFLNQTLYGRVGRTGLLPLKKRQMETAGSKRLTFELRASLFWLIELLYCCPPREINIHRHSKPALLYTDGSAELARDPPFYVGAVLILPNNRIYYTGAAVPPEVVATWTPRIQQIYLVELFAGPLALATFSNVLSDCDVIHFVDNNAALGALVKGYSNKDDAIRIVADYWLRAAALKLSPYIDRVESKSNLSDEPSRPDLQQALMRALKAKFVAPALQALTMEESRDPSDWFGGQIRWPLLKEELLSKLSSL